MSIVAIIPARAGSKGIKNKNLIDFCGKPLLAWSVIQAVESKRIDRVYVSTNGDTIAETACQYGARVIKRPEELSSDTASSETALLHALTEIENELPVDMVVFLQATSPLRTHNDIDKAIQMFLEKGYDSMFSMCLLEDYCIWKRQENLLSSFTYDYMNRGRRQDREPLYLENGSIYIFRPEIIKRYHNRLGGQIGMYEMPFEHSYEIDSEKDIEICEFFMRKVISDYEKSIL